MLFTAFIAYFLRNNAAPLNGTALRKVPKRKDAAPPTTALAKYRLRVMVGRRTNRMDLASREVWAEAGDAKPSSAPAAKVPSNSTQLASPEEKTTSAQSAQSTEFDLVEPREDEEQQAAETRPSAERSTVGAVATRFVTHESATSR